jgi:lipoate-protein ligase A
MIFAYFGNMRTDAYLNMAIDEVILRKSEKEKKNYIRFYEFSVPSFVLAYRQHPSEVTASENDFHITRRLSSGGVMLCNDSSLAYSMTLSSAKKMSVKNVHNFFGTKIAEVVKEYAENQEVHLGDHFSVRVDGKIIAGHGQRDANKTVLYHGVLALYPWDTGLIEANVKLKEGELEYVKSLPCLHDYSNNFKKDEIMNKMLEKIAGDGLVYLDQNEKQEIIDKAMKLAENQYRNPKWINFGPNWEEENPNYHANNLLTGWGFCFADIQSPEPVSKKIR